MVMAMFYGWENVSGWRIQEMNHEILDRHLLSTNEMEKSQLMNVYHRGKSLSYLSACGFFGISKSSLTSMLSVR